MEFIPKNAILEFHPNTLEVIRKTYNLENGRMKQSVDLLEDWVMKQRHFEKKQFSRAYYEFTLVSCKGSVEKAKSQIDKLCTLKTLLPNFFICHDLRENISTLTLLVCCLPLPKMTKEYQRIYLIKTFEGSITSANIFNFFQLNIMVTEYLKAHDYVDGMVVVEDFREANLMEIIKNINFVQFQQVLTILIEGFGARIKGIHIISESKIIDLFINTVKQWLSPKIANRIYGHQNLDTVYDVIDKELLPVDLGGSQKSIRELQDMWINEVCSEEHHKYLEVMVDSRTDESLRQLDKFNEQYMGMPGSFRTLTVD